MNPSELTDEKIAKIAEDTENRIKLARQQLDEYKIFLRKWLRFDALTKQFESLWRDYSTGQWTLFIDRVADIRLVSITQQGAELELCYDYPEELHALLLRPEIPDEISLRNAASVGEDATAPRVVKV